MRRILLGMILCCAAMPALTAEEDIVLRGMGSFHVGGRVAEVSGKPVRMIVRQPGGPQTKLDPNGQYMVEQMYVQYFLPKQRKGKLPLLMWHGGGLTGVTYESTPDGREGWLNMFVRKGWDVYVSDAVERGRAGFASPDVWTVGADIPDLRRPVRALSHRRRRGLLESRSGQTQGAARKPVPGGGLRQLHEAVGAALALDRRRHHRRLCRAGGQGLPVRAAAAQPRRRVRLQGRGAAAGQGQGDRRGRVGDRGQSRQGRRAQGHAGPDAVRRLRRPASALGEHSRRSISPMPTRCAPAAAPST